MTWNIPSLDALKNENFQPLKRAEFQRTLFQQKKLYFFAKRVIDIFGSFIGIILCFPIYIIISILVVIDSPGPIIFAHQRVGKNGKIFTIYKFRTMRRDVKDQEMAPTSDQDVRVTKVGRVLRKLSLDEIPQFINVLKGDMSLVGPRPEMEFITKNYSVIEKCRLLVKPGLTGIWQIKGRKDLPLHANVEFDLYYIMKMSLILDLRVLLSTISVVLSGKGAY